MGTSLFAAPQEGDKLSLTHLLPLSQVSADCVQVVPCLSLVCSGCFIYSSLFLFPSLLRSPRIPLSILGAAL